MGELAASPGVVKIAARLFVTNEDVMKLFGCGRSKAYRIVQEVNAHAKEMGKRPLPAGKANKYLFSDLYGIPVDEIEKIISDKEEG